MKDVLFTMSIAILLLSGCKSDNQKTIACDTIDEAVAKLEVASLASHNTNRVFSIKERNRSLINDYEIVYVGSIKIKNTRFDLLKKTVLSGQEMDSQRANVSLMLFVKNKLFGEYTGLKNSYSVSVRSNAIMIYNKETRRTVKVKIYDTIPTQLFIPYSCSDSILLGDMLYLNKKIDSF